MGNTEQKIIAYLNNELTRQERKTFERQIREDAALRQEVKFYRSLSKVVGWKAAMKEAHQEQGITAVANPDIRPAKVRPLGFRQVLSLAASFLVLAVCGMMWFTNTPTLTNVAVAPNLKTKLNLNEGAWRSGETVEISPLQEGFDDIDADRFEEAIQFFQNITIEDELYDDAQLSSAYAAYKMEKYTRTIQYAREAISHSDEPVLHQKAEWLIIKSKLANKEQDNAFNSLLQKIAKQDTHLFQNEAKILVRDAK